MQIGLTDDFVQLVDVVEQDFVAVRHRAAVVVAVVAAVAVVFLRDVFCALRDDLDLDVDDDVTPSLSSSAFSQRRHFGPCRRRP